jgi:hypothetical protein
LRPLRKSYVCHSEGAQRPKNLVILISSRSFASLRMTIMAFSQRPRIGIPGLASQHHRRALSGPPLRAKRPFFKKNGAEKAGRKIWPGAASSGGRNCQVFWQNVRYFATPNLAAGAGRRKKKRLMGAISRGGGGDNQNSLGSLPNIELLAID